MQLEKPLHACAIAVISALLLAAAWWVPGTLLCAALGWLAAAFIILIPYSGAPYRAAFLLGLVVHPLAFYWLFGTIRDFGYFPIVPALLIFALFVVLSSVQFLFFILAYRLCAPALDRFALAVPVAWIIAEGFSVRIFPWHLGHTQLAFTPLAQTADLAGSICISFIMLWLLNAALRVADPAILNLEEIRSLRPLSCALALFAAACVYGSSQMQSFSRGGTALHGLPEVPAVLVQGNISLAQKHNSDLVRSNVARYQQLATAAATGQFRSDRPLPLVILPETVLLDFISEEVGHIKNDRRLPRVPLRSDDTRPLYAPLLYGALAYNHRREIFNSVFSSSHNGSIEVPYHKQLLMPFGEYTPFGETFPWLKAINSTVGDFSRGAGPVVFKLELDPNNPDHVFKAAPLVCYEDVAPRLSRAAVRSGAQLLVNVTNDAWFGDTVAPYQHNLIASFRAVENKRYLLRATNTGLTNIVNPLGKTIASLPGYSEGALAAPVLFIDRLTLYSAYIGDATRWVFLLLWAACSIWVTIRRRRGPCS